ncbi:MAG: VOC family protein [Firmicutes bacterium]|nr:VOC family protein [Bacillota bacterium]
MADQGIEALYLTTHNWGRAVKFLQALGFELEFDTGHQSGQLRCGAGAYVFVAEVPAEKVPEMAVVVKVPSEAVNLADNVGDVVTPWEDTHWGTREMTVRDPDGRMWRLQAPRRS